MAYDDDDMTEWYILTFVHQECSFEARVDERTADYVRQAKANGSVHCSFSSLDGAVYEVSPQHLWLVLYRSLDTQKRCGNQDRASADAYESGKRKQPWEED